ncbi:MAG: TadA family conjugal transfer-associated ATPase [Corynebacteriales bacterium]|nr:TadA family conjugal transfer-associated ATPase [Mycobacteriales bacterium]
MTPRFLGLGPLAPLLNDSGITDVVVNAGRAWVDRGNGLERTDVGFADDVTLRQLAQRLANACGRRLDDAQPWVDARLPDGTRLHAVLPPLATDGVALSLRTFRRRVFTLQELHQLGTIEQPALAILRAIIAARLSYVVTGGTGSGKTTLLSSLLSATPPNERIIAVEDVTELRPAHPHVVSLQARAANSEGSGAVTLRELVRQALRMRPDRIVVGECRGAEITELLSALNTGHDGSAGTVHANSPADVPARLEALAAVGGLSSTALRAQVAAGLQCVVHLARVSTGRIVSEIGVIVADTALSVQPAWRSQAAEQPGLDTLRHKCAQRGVQL